MRLVLGTVAMGMLMSCQQRHVDNAAADNAVAPVTAGNEAAPATKADSTPDRTPLSEPKGPIDPKSAEAAGQVVQRFGALIEQGRWKEAEALFGDKAMAAKALAPLRGYWELRLEIGPLSEPEGAAGSVYVSMPISFFGKKVDGIHFRDAATVVLRRVNDVPGSTEAQRRWHISRIDAR